MLVSFLMIAGVVFVLNGGLTTNVSRVGRAAVTGFLTALLLIVAYRVADSYGLIPKRLRTTVTSTIEELRDEGRSKLNELK